MREKRKEKGDRARGARPGLFRSHIGVSGDRLLAHKTVVVQLPLEGVDPVIHMAARTFENVVNMADLQALMQEEREKAYPIYFDMTDNIMYILYTSDETAKDQLQDTITRCKEELMHQHNTAVQEIGLRCWISNNDYQTEKLRFGEIMDKLNKFEGALEYSYYVSQQQENGM